MTTDNDKQTPESDVVRVKTSDDIEVSTYLQIAKEIGGEKPESAGEAAPPEEIEAIIVVDFGSQYSLLIARRIREANVYCEIVSYDTPWEKIAHLKPKGFVLSGGPASVYQEGSPLAPAWVYEKHVPVLGICYGMQVITKQLGGRVAPGDRQEYGHAVLHVNDRESPLMVGLDDAPTVWMSHGDRIEEMPQGFKILAYTENSPVAIMGSWDSIYGLQFHPEVAHTPQGKTILRNFVYNICGCHGNWTIGNFINDSITRTKNLVGDVK